jgi:hypothetical protein
MSFFPWQPVKSASGKSGQAAKQGIIGYLYGIYESLSEREE